MAAESLSGLIGNAEWWASGDCIPTAKLQSAMHANEDLMQRLHGTKVMIGTGPDVEKVLALALLDGHADLVYLPPDDLDDAIVSQHIAELDIGTEISTTPRTELPAHALNMQGGEPGRLRAMQPLPHRETRLALTTSGTTRTPKLVHHSRSAISRKVRQSPRSARLRWGLLYDPTRFAGLQVALHAIQNGAPLISVDRSSSLVSQVQQLLAGDVTALSATPSMWRRLLIAGVEKARLEQVTLGGEPVDQGVLDALRATFPPALVTHIYASTEAGVGFSVHDGKAGFPAAFADGRTIDVRQGRLFVRGNGDERGATAVEDGETGWIDTGDDVEEEGARYLFLGRANGAINVGGQKVHPEQVEQVILTVPGVRMARVYGRPNPMVGQLVAAELELVDGCRPDAVAQAVRTECARTLPKYKVPTRISVVPRIETLGTGKVRRGET